VLPFIDQSGLEPGAESGHGISRIPLLRGLGYTAFRAGCRREVP